MGDFDPENLLIDTIKHQVATMASVQCRLQGTLQNLDNTMDLVTCLDV